MSDRPLPACRIPDCPHHQAYRGAGYCPGHLYLRPETEHALEHAPYDARRRADGSRLPQHPLWRSMAAHTLAEHPFCRPCEIILGLPPAPATAVDHIIPRRLAHTPAVRAYLEQSGFRSVNARALRQSICQPCHNRKTRIEERQLADHGLQSVDAIERWVRFWIHGTSMSQPIA